jgi:F1F0 ATPase subunit 2
MPGIGLKKSKKVSRGIKEMFEFIVLTIPAILGIILGVFYFGGLWLTLKHLSISHQTTLLALGSFLGRSMICILGFYLAARNGWEWLVFSLVGFILAKLTLTRLLGHYDCKDVV